MSSGRARGAQVGDQHARGRAEQLAGARVDEDAPYAGVDEVAVDGEVHRQRLVGSFEGGAHLVRPAHDLGQVAWRCTVGQHGHAERAQAETVEAGRLLRHPAGGTARLCGYGRGRRDRDGGKHGHKGSNGEVALEHGDNPLREREPPMPVGRGGSR